MPTSARKRTNFDVLRMGMAVSYPGIDPRTWVTAARVDDDQQAFRWDEHLGWIVDVTPYGGRLDGVDEVPARIAGQSSGDGFGEYIPPSRNEEVLVALPGGDVEENPVVLGGLTNRADGLAPKSVNGLPIASGSEPVSSNLSSVSPFDTEIKVSPFNRREEFGGETFIQSQKRVIETIQATSSLLLGSRNANEAFIKGTSYLQEQATLYSRAATQFGVLASASTGPLAPLAAAFGELATAFGEAAAKQATFASLKIQGE